MHAVLQKLVALSFGACALVGCKHVCNTHEIARDARTVDVANEHPDLIAEAWATSNLTSGTYSLSLPRCREACGPKVVRCDLVVHFEPVQHPTTGDGSVHCVFGTEERCREDFDPFGMSSCPFGCGRMPAFVDPSRSEDVDPLVRHFVDVARLESLSVAAFAQLATELARMRASKRMLDRVARARADERRHARAARKVLRSLGGRPRTTPRVPMRRRALEALALDNAVEGCVRETYGAIVACMQAERADDARIRAFFRSIARDELRHAALSWDVHEVLVARLDREARARVTAAQRHALEQIASSASEDESVRRTIGAPSSAERRSIARAMSQTLPFEAL